MSWKNQDGYISGDEEFAPVSFEKWYNSKDVALQEKFIENNPELFPTDESMCEIEDNYDFQSYCEREYENYVEKVK